MSGVEEVLAGLELEVAPFAVCTVAGGHALDLPAQPALSVHYALTGAGRLRFAGGDSVAFAPDTVAICPAGLAQRIQATHAEPGRTRCLDAALGLDWIAGGAPPYAALFACGRVAARPAGALTPFQGLSAPLVEPAPPDGPIAQAMRALLAEFAEPALGGRAMAQSLMKQALILVLRRLVDRADDRLPWLRALGDPQLGPVAADMLLRPERTGDLDSLAERAGMSRSSFVARFGAVFGQSPHAFLVVCRLQRAARLLARTDWPVKTVAGEVGYRSRSHFSRAFKAHFGRDPVTWRHAQG